MKPFRMVCFWMREIWSNKMTDIIKCNRQDCPIKKKCWRYMAPADGAQSWAKFMWKKIFGSANYVICNGYLFIKEKRTHEFIKTIVVIIAVLLLWFIMLMLGSMCWASADRFVSIGKHEISSYNAIRDQCDSTPWEGAYGIVADKNGNPTGNWFASNFLAKGVKIIIPKISGKKIWICRDKLNEKIWWRIDILKPLGQTIGLRYEEVLILK